MERQDNPPFLTRKDLAFQEGKQFGIEINIITDRPYIVIMRGITKEGPFEYNTINTQTYTSEQFFFAMPDIPIMLTLEIKPDGLPVVYGKVVAYLTVNKSRYGVLVQGNLNGFDTLSWPNQLPLTPLQERGFIKSDTTTDPAAGAIFSIILTSTAWLRLKGVTFKLAAAAGGAARRVVLAINPINTGYIFMASPVDQAAGSTRTYMFGEGLDAREDITSQLIQAPLLADLMLPPTSIITVSMMNLGLSDQFSNIRTMGELHKTVTP